MGMYSRTIRIKEFLRRRLTYSISNFQSNFMKYLVSYSGIGSCQSSTQAVHEMRMRGAQVAARAGGMGC